MPESAGQERGNRWVGLGVGAFVGFWLGLVAGHKLHLQDPRAWVLCVAAGVVLLAVVFFVKPPPGLDWPGKGSGK